MTEGTTRKWWAVTAIYIIALLATAGVTVWFGTQSWQLVEKINLESVKWWQWTLLTVKPILPLGAFTSLLIYFIRWYSSWSRQHVDEEFRNRARVLDIGRSAWLLEAVRDAQDNQKELPSDLLKELSKNLFNRDSSSDAKDLYPAPLNDLLLQSLSSFRVKGPNGAEVEAKRDVKG